MPKDASQGLSIASDSQIESLIACPKVFRQAPSKAIEKNRNSSQKFHVFSEEDGTQFSIFIAYSMSMPLDFSLGLMADRFLLCRCNGFHGTTKAGFFTAEHHAYPHLHRLTMTDIENDRMAHPSHIEPLGGQFADLLGARMFFFKKCGILGFEKYFDCIEQIRLL